MCSSSGQCSGCGGHFLPKLIANGVWSSLLVTLIAGCTVLAPVAPNREAIVRELDVGDRLELRTTSGDTFEASVSELTDDAIVIEAAEGQRIAIAYTDVTEIRRRAPARGKSVGLALGIVAAIAVIQLSSGDDLLRFPGAPTGL